MDFAVNGLRSVQLSPARTLELIYEYRHVRHFRPWIEPAVKALLELSLSQISKQEEKQIAGIYRIFARTREQLQEARSLIAASPLPLLPPPTPLPGQLPECSPEAHALCISFWQRYWVVNISPLIGPANRISYMELLNTLEKIHSQKLNPLCHQRTVDFLRTKSNFPKMDGYVRDAVAEIEQMYDIPQSPIAM